MENRENVGKESKKEVLIIIPAYNEEKTIVSLLEKLEQPEIAQVADVLVNGKLPDIVLGSRFMEGSSGFSVSFAKKIAFVWFRIMLKTGTGRRITDPTTGLQGLNWRTFLFYSKYNNFDDKYPDANMLMQMLLLGFRVREIPAVMHVRTTGVSMHSGLKPVLYMFRMTFSILAVWIREKILKMDEDKIRELEKHNE